MKRHKLTTTVRTNMGQYCVTPLWVAEAVSGRALQLFVILAAKYADRENEEAMVSRRGLAKVLGCSLATADRCIEELVAVSALEIENRYDRGGNQVENVYRLIYSKPARPLVTSDYPTLITSEHPRVVSPLVTGDYPSDQEYQEEADAQFPFPESAETQERTADEKSLPVQRTASSVSVQPGEKFFSPGPEEEFEIPEPDWSAADLPPRLRLMGSRLCDACGEAFTAVEGQEICGECLAAYVASRRDARSAPGVPS